MLEVPAAFRADQLAAATELVFGSLMRAAQMMDDGFFEDVGAATRKASLAHRNAGRFTARTRDQLVEELAFKQPELNEVFGVMLHARDRALVGIDHRFARVGIASRFEPAVPNEQSRKQMYPRIVRLKHGRGERAKPRDRLLQHQEGVGYCRLVGRCNADVRPARVEAVTAVLGRVDHGDDCSQGGR